MVAGTTTMERHWTFSRRLRERRHALGLTQTDVVARLAARGAPLSNRALSTMENGRGLDLGWLPDLAGALECTVTYLLGLTDDPGRWEPDAAPGAGAPETAAKDPPSKATPHRRNWILGPDPPSRPQTNDSPSPDDRRASHRRPA
jgi:transcriptional regulator with XRE-family HTH domain